MKHLSTHCPVIARGRNTSNAGNYFCYSGSSFKGVLLLLSVILFLTAPLKSYSQRVSVNTTGAAPNPSAGLDIDFTNKGLLIPRVSLTSTTSSAPLSAHVAGMVVFNTATAGDVTPGFYYDNGVKWVRIVQSASTAGTMLYWDGSKWALLPPGTPGQRLQLDPTGVPAWK